MKQNGNGKIAGVLILTGILTIGGSAAFMTAFDQRVNMAAVGHNTTTIQEEFPSPEPIPVTENPEYVKKVWVSNTTSAEEGYNTDCFVRVSLSFSNDDIGKAVTLKNLDGVNWEYHNDGYYYYKGILKEGENTPALFTGISIDSSKLDEDVKGYCQDFSVSVYEESIQTGHFTNFYEAWNYYLHPLETV